MHQQCRRRRGGSRQRVTATDCRSGEIFFLATGDRRFWRMQDLLNCDGSITDYVDIYFG